MIRFVSMTLIAMILAAHLSAAESKELHAAKAQYAQLPHPSEADRERYVTTLARQRDKFAHAGATADWQAVDAEIRRHPVPKDSDPKALARLLVGKWTSPRHEYLFRKDGTWIMLPDEPGTTNGEWRIAGNRYLSTVATPESYTLLLLTGHDFIYTDGKIVFYETRTSK